MVGSVLPIQRGGVIFAMAAARGGSGPDAGIVLLIEHPVAAVPTASDNLVIRPG